MPPVPMLINVVQDMSGSRAVVDGYRPPVGFDTIRCATSSRRSTMSNPSLMVDFETQGNGNEDHRHNYARGATINTGNFNSVRLDVSVTAHVR